MRSISKHNSNGCSNTLFCDSYDNLHILCSRFFTLTVNDVIVIARSYNYLQDSRLLYPSRLSFKMSGIRDLIIGEADLDDDDEGDDSFDEETGEVKRSVNGKNRVNGINGHLDDSSEEEDDDDEEAAQAVENLMPIPRAIR